MIKAEAIAYVQGLTLIEKQALLAFLVALEARRCLKK